MKKLIDGVLFESSGAVRRYIVRFRDDPNNSEAFPIALERVIETEVATCEQRLYNPKRKYSERTIKHCKYLLEYIEQIRCFSSGPDCAIETPHGLREETLELLVKKALRILNDVAQTLTLEELIEDALIDALDAMDEAHHNRVMAELLGLPDFTPLPPDLLEMEALMSDLEQRLTLDELRQT